MQFNLGAFFWEAGFFADCCKVNNSPELMLHYGSHFQTVRQKRAKYFREAEIKF